MATLMIPDVDAALSEQLQARAARHGRSVEAELRCILTKALKADQTQEPTLAEAIHRRFAPLGGVELEPQPWVSLGDPPRLEG